MSSQLFYFSLIRLFIIFPRDDFDLSRSAMHFLLDKNIETMIHLYFIVARTLVLYIEPE